MHKQYILNVAGVIYRDDAYLLMTRSEADDYAAGEFSLVGGGIEASDEAQPDLLKATLQREIMEEVGVEVDQLNYVTATTFPYHEHTVLNVVFLCHYVSGEAHPVDPAEVGSVHWMTAEQIAAHPEIRPWTKGYIAAAQQLRASLG